MHTAYTAVESTKGFCISGFTRNVCRDAQININKAHRQNQLSKLITTNIFYLTQKYNKYGLHNSLAKSC